MFISPLFYSLPGDNGFDPLGLGEDPENLKWYVQAELQNGRWAMLGVSMSKLLYRLDLHCFAAAFDPESTSGETTLTPLLHT